MGSGEKVRRSATPKGTKRFAIPLADVDSYVGKINKLQVANAANVSRKNVNRH